MKLMGDIGSEIRGEETAMVEEGVLKVKDGRIHDGRKGGGKGRG